MTSLGIDNSILRVAEYANLAGYFKQLLSRLSNEDLTDYLLSGLANDTLPFRTIAVWIAGFANAPSLAKCIRFDLSAGVRRVALRHFAKSLRSGQQTNAAFSAVGGPSGLVHLFSTLSVHDVQSFCCALGRTSTWTVGRERRRQQLTKLVEGLISPDNPDPRTFVMFYAKIVPACTDVFVRLWEADGKLPRAGGKWMDQAHYRHTRGRCMQHLVAERGKGFKIGYFENVLYWSPPLRASKYMSESMAFSLEVLDYIGSGELPALDMSTTTILDTLVTPLLRRLKRRRASHDVTAKVLSSVAKALAGRSTEGGGVAIVPPESPLRYAVACWNRDAVAHQKMLVDIMQLVPKGQETFVLGRVATLLNLVRLSLRYELLSLAAKHMKSIDRDLEDDAALSDLGPWPTSIFQALGSAQSYALLQRLINLRPKDQWPGDLFTALDPEHAVSLLEDLTKLRPAGEFIDWGALKHLRYSIFSMPHNQDLRILRLCVSPPSEQRKSGWKAVVSERQKEASRARDAEERATWARSAALCALASDSMVIYRETMLWARRFNADFATTQKLYKEEMHAASLLSGIPSDRDLSSTTVDELDQRIRYGNEILLLLLETAFQALREPHFQHYHWKRIPGLFRSVVQHRITRANSVQEALALTDDEMYDMLWRDTLTTLLSAEKQCLAEEHRKLEAHSPVGLVHGLTFDKGAATPSACRFVDELARSRDEMWAEYRRKQDPNVLSLGAPFPQGMSFQDMKPCSDEVEGAAGKLPFLEARAEGIVFADSSSLLSPCPRDASVRKAIGLHVDSYRDVLEFYVQVGVDAEDRRRRKEAAWRHAIGPLSTPRGLSERQAWLFWADKFSHGSPFLESQEEYFEIPHRPHPALPRVRNPAEPTEWNPDPDPARWTQKARELEPTCLDVMLTPHRTETVGDAELLEVPIPSTASIVHRAYWDDPAEVATKSINPSGREAFIALALLLINSKYCPTLRLFSAPFPSAEDARFPAIYLDDDFLERDGMDVVKGEHAFRMVERLSKDVPLTLVARLCEAMMLAIDRKEKVAADLEASTFRLLKVLVESDRPDLALGLVRKVVVERPESSSWHRHLLTKGLMDRLMSGQARGFLGEMVDSIANGLQQQAQRKAGPEGEAQVPSTPRVKVTTVTAMAQLLSGANFVSGQETVGILSRLFAQASHPDIRVALVESMVAILKQTRDLHLKEEIVDALATHAVPVASSMNERSPMSEEDWQKAESALVIPEVHEPSSRGMQPVLCAIVGAYSALAGDLMGQLHRRVLLPIWDASAANNRRWMQLFLRKHNLRCPIETLPLVPPKPLLLQQLTDKPVQERREELFQLRGDFVMANLEPPADLHRANHLITSNKDIRDSNGGKHWLALWHNNGTAALTCAGQSLHQYLVKPPSPSAPSYPIPLLQHLVWRQLSATLTSHASVLTSLLSDLRRPIHKAQPWELTWDANIRPLIHRLVAHIDGSLRTPQWQRQSHRVPATLPDTFDMRLWLLTWPSWSVSPALLQSDHDVKLTAFARELGGMLREICGSEKPYHARFAKVKQAALEVHPVDMAGLAVYFGADWEALRLEDYLGVEMAEALLQRATVAPRKQAEMVVGQVGEMVRSWRGSADEDVRMAGLGVVRMLEWHRHNKVMSTMGWFWDGWGRERDL